MSSSGQPQLVRPDQSGSNRPRPAEICYRINAALESFPSPGPRGSAARWNTTAYIVNLGNPTQWPTNSQPPTPLSRRPFKPLSHPDTPQSPQVRANVKWSCILLNRVPNGTSPSNPASTPGQCHRALATKYPTSPSPRNLLGSAHLVPDDAVSFLTFSFEDPDCTRLQALPRRKVLFAFGQAALNTGNRSLPQNTSTLLRFGIIN
jgi:hypothetical protein